MWIKNRIKELKLTCALSNRMECERVLGLECDAYNFDCTICVNKNTEVHTRWVAKNKEFYCGDQCDLLRKRFGTFEDKIEITEEECEKCEINMKKYLKEDFKNVFNNIGDKHVE